MPALSRKPLLSLISASLLCAFAAANTAKAQVPPHPVITLSATGTIAVVPDSAVVTSSVVSQAEDAQSALAQNSRALRAVISEIQKAGIDEQNIQTSGFSISPVYTRPQVNNGEPAMPQLSGYRVTNGITIRVEKLPILGGLLDKIVKSGANRIGNIDFDISNRNRFMDEARKKAVTEARRKAEIYADAINAKVGMVIDFKEEASSSPRPMMMMRAAEANISSAPPIAAGEELITATVTIAYEILQ